MNIHSIIIVLIIILYGCDRVPEKQFIDNFTFTKSLNYTVINTSELYLYYPIRMLKIQNMTIIADYKGDSIFTVIKDSREIFKFGNRGKGPDDFITGYGLTPLSDTTFVIFDRVLNKIAFFKAADDTIQCYKKLKIPVAINNVFPYNESILVTNGNAPFTMNYGVIDLDNDSVYSFVEYPQSEENDLPTSAKIRAYYSHIIRKPNSNRFISFKANHHIIDVMDLDRNHNLKLIRRKIFNKYQWEMSTKMAIPGRNGRLNIFTAPTIACSENRVYACYKYQKKIKTEHYLLTFDWNGNPQNRYIIPFTPYAITGLNDSTLYCVGLIDSEYNLIKINIPK